MKKNCCEKYSTEKKACKKCPLLAEVRDRHGHVKRSKLGHYLTEMPPRSSSVQLLAASDR